jgi:hypothetical protein
MEGGHLKQVDTQTVSSLRVNLLSEDISLKVETSSVVFVFAQ